MHPFGRAGRSFIRCHFAAVTSSQQSALYSAFPKQHKLLSVVTTLVRAPVSCNIRRFLRTEFFRRQGAPAMNQAKDGWLTIGNYNVYAWSLSGVETCIVVKADDLKVAFDMGTSIPESISCGHVFISHGHLDHIGGVANHAAKRGLFGMKKARYFVPPHLVDLLRSVTDASAEMAETSEALRDVHVLPLDVGDRVELPGNYSVVSFPTEHRVRSQGYILYKTARKLKPEYMGQPSADIAQLHRSGVDIHHTITTPEIAYTGDTMIDVFLNPPTPDLLKVKLLITEATYLEASGRHDDVKLAKARGHTHLSEISGHADLFKDVGKILLVHFSNKYSPDYVRQCVTNTLGPQLSDKVLCATVAKEHHF